MRVTAPELNAPVRSRLDARLLTLLLIAAALAVAILAHMPGLDGPWYSHWGWRRTSGTLVYPAMLGAAIPFFGALILYETRRVDPRLLLPLLVLSHFLFQLVVISLLNALSFSLDTFIDLVVHLDALSYFADAATLVGGGGSVRDWLTNYPDLLPQMFLPDPAAGPISSPCGFVCLHIKR